MRGLVVHHPRRHTLMFPARTFSWLLLLLLCALPWSLSALSTSLSSLPQQQRQQQRRRPFQWRSVRATTTTSTSTTTTSTESLVDQILDYATEKDEDKSGKGEAERREAVLPLVLQLMEPQEPAAANGDATSPLLFGLYDIPFVLTPRAGDSPAGGRWTKRGGLAQRLFRTRGTFQHLLPVNSTGLTPSTPAFCRNETNQGWVLAAANETKQKSAGDLATAEGINVVSLEALFSLIRLTIILRGDAVPLSAMEREELAAKSSSSSSGSATPPLTSRACRIFFDPPRLFWGRRGRCNFSLGPATRVILDAPYVDERLRIGRGGRSNTKFVFRRVKETDSSEASPMVAQEYRDLLARPPVPRAKLLEWNLCTGLTGVVWNLLVARRPQSLLWRVTTGLSFAALAFALVLWRSNGGIILREEQRR